MGKRGPQKGVHYAKTLAKRRGRARALRLAEVTEQRVTLELARIGFTDRRGIWADSGIKALKDWTQDEAALLEGVEVIKKNAEAGDGHVDIVHKIHLAKKGPALELLAKKLGMLVEKHEHKVAAVSLEELVAGSRDA